MGCVPDLRVTSSIVVPKFFAVKPSRWVRVVERNA
jgi:hypothetical protein